MELNTLENQLGIVKLDYSRKDCWLWRHGKDGAYSAKKYYVCVHLPIVSNPLRGWIWKICCTLKIRFLLGFSLWTGLILKLC